MLDPTPTPEAIAKPVMLAMLDAWLAHTKLPRHVLRDRSVRFLTPELERDGHVLLVEDTQPWRLVLIGPCGAWYAYREQVMERPFWQIWPLYKEAATLAYQRRTMAYARGVLDARYAAQEKSRDGMAYFVHHVVEPGKDPRAALKASARTRHEGDQVLAVFQNGEDVTQSWFSGKRTSHER